MRISSLFGSFEVVMSIQSHLIIVDSSVSGKFSTIKRESTIMREMHAKIDNPSAEHNHYNERFHYYKIYYYQRRRYYIFVN